MRRGRARPFLVITGSILLVLVVLCCGVGAWWFQRTASAERELAARKDELAIAGYPIDNASLAAYYERLNDDRTTARWEAMLEYLASDAFFKTTQGMPILDNVAFPPEPGTPWPQLEEARQFLESHRETLTELHALASMDHPVQFDRRWQGLETILDEMQPLRTAARLLKLEHCVAMHDADAAREFGALDGLIGVALTLRGDPTIACQLVALALQGIADGALDRSLTRGAFSQQQLDRLSERLLLLSDYDARIECMLAGERALALEAIDGSGQIDEPGIGIPYKLGVGSRNALHYLDTIERAQRIPFTPIERYVSRMRAVSQDLQDDMETSNLLARLDTIMTATLTPPLDAVADAFVRLSLRNRLSLLAIAVERHRLEHGKFPEAIGPLLDRLSNQLPPKSISKSHFGYRVQEGTAELWTISTDGRRAPLPWQADTEPPDPQANGAEPLGFLRTWYLRLDGGGGVTD